MLVSHPVHHARFRSPAPRLTGALLVFAALSPAATLLPGLFAEPAATDRIPRIADSTTTSRTAPRADVSSLRVLAQADSKPAPAAPVPAPAQSTVPAAGATTAPGAPATPGGAAPPGGFGGRTRSGRGGVGGAFPGAEAAEGMKIDGDKVTLQFPNNTINDILGIYELLTNKTLIKDTTIFEGQSISLITPQPVEKQEAVKLIEASMMTNGYVIIADPSGTSARILPTRSRESRELQFSQGVKFYQSANDLPDNETLVSYFMKLDHLDPSIAAQTLGNHVGLSIYGRMTPVSTPPGLLITESAAMVRQLISIKEVIDSQDSANALITKFIPLRYADASTVAQIVQATLDAQASDKEQKGLTTIRGSGPISMRNTSSGSPPPPPSPTPSPQSSGGTASSAQKKPEAKSQVVADPRLNQLLVVSEPLAYPYIASLIAEFDRPVDVPIAYERKLKNIYSIDVLSVLADLLKDTGKSTSQLPGGGTLNMGQQQLVSSSSSLITGRSSSSSAQRGGTISRTGTTGGSSDSTTGSSTVGSSRPDQLVESTQDNAPISVLVNKTRIIADPMANSIIIIGPKEDQDKVEMLLDKLDQKSPQAYLHTVIGELTLDRNVSAGVDWLQHFYKNQPGGVASSNINSRTDLITNNNISDVTNNAITSPFGPVKGFNLYGQLGTALDTLVSMIEVDSNFRVLSRPSVFVTNNKKAVITSGQSIPVPESTTQYANSTGVNNNNGNITTQITYKDVVLKLEVIPLIDPDGVVTLKIAQVNDTVIGQQLIAQNNVPIISTEQITSTVTIPNGNTIVLGGLISEQFKKDSSGIPWISRIPVLGYLFKTNTDSKIRKELIIFIHPQVVRNDLALRQQSLKEDLRTKVGEEAYRSYPDKPIPVALPVIEEPVGKPAKKTDGGNGLKQPANSNPASANR